MTLMSLEEAREYRDLMLEIETCTARMSENLQQVREHMQWLGSPDDEDGLAGHAREAASLTHSLSGAKEAWEELPPVDDLQQMASEAHNLASSLVEARQTFPE